jgi:hypothetical protein
MREKPNSLCTWMRVLGKEGGERGGTYTGGEFEGLGVCGHCVSCQSLLMIQRQSIRRREGETGRRTMMRAGMTVLLPFLPKKIPRAPPAHQRTPRLTCCYDTIVSEVVTGEIRGTDHVFVAPVTTGFEKVVLGEGLAGKSVPARWKRYQILTLTTPQTMMTQASRYS